MNRIILHKLIETVEKKTRLECVHRQCNRNSNDLAEVFGAGAYNLKTNDLWIEIEGLTDTIEGLKQQLYDKKFKKGVGQ